MPSLLLRNLGLAAAVVILGGGTLASVHLMRMSTAPAPEAAAPVAQPDAKAVRVAAALAAPEPQPAPSLAAPSIVAPSIVAPSIAAPSIAAADAPSAGASPAAAQAAPEAAPNPTPNGAPVVRPTQADFERPAFLEPLGTDPAELRRGPDAPADTARADPVEVAAIALPPDAKAPLPLKRPADLSSAADDDKGDDAKASGAKDDAVGGRAGRIVMDINLRTAPRRASSVIGTVAAGTKVTVISCKSWCEVVAKGKRGYVYRRAVDR